MKQKLEKWQREIVRIREAVVRLADYRRWNRVYEAIVNANPRLIPGTPVLNYFRNVYGDYAVMAIRRQAKPHRDSVSLLGLLEDIAANASFITRNWTREMYQQPLEGSGHVYDASMAIWLADKTFKEFADSTGLQLNRELVDADVESLRNATREVIAVSDTAIAHDDRRGPEFVVTFDHLNQAIDVIEEITRRYVCLLTGASMTRMTPYDQTNSIGVFRFPWIDPEHPPSLGNEPL
jgi:hypothetical protein